MPKLIPEPVLTILDRSTTEGAVLFLPKEQLDRPMYEAVNKVLQAAGGKWDRKAGGHVFPTDAAAILEGITLTGLVTDAKREFNAFFTPPELADMLAISCGIVGGDLVLEPSAGEGRLVAAAIRRGGQVVAVELQEQYGAALKAAGASRVHPHDFMEVEPSHLGPRFNRVLMNPPFAKQQDIKHVTHAISFLEPGGVLVSVMSAGVRFRDDGRTVAFRDMVEGFGGVFTDLPEGSFRASGTDVNTCVVRIVKPV